MSQNHKNTEIGQLIYDIQKNVKLFGDLPLRKFLKSLDKIELDIKQLKSLYHEKEIRSITRKCIKTNNEVLTGYAQAVLHQIFKEKPTIKDLAYLIANDYNSDTLSASDKVLFSKLSKHFDKNRYVFNNTKYDESDGGYYFRRS